MCVCVCVGVCGVVGGRKSSNGLGCHTDMWDESIEVTDQDDT